MNTRKTLRPSSRNSMRRSDYTVRVGDSRLRATISAPGKLFQWNVRTMWRITWWVELIRSTWREYLRRPGFLRKVWNWVGMEKTFGFSTWMRPCFRIFHIMWSMVMGMFLILKAWFFFCLLFQIAVWLFWKYRKDEKIRKFRDLDFFFYFIWDLNEMGFWFFPAFWLLCNEIG